MENEGKLWTIHPFLPVLEMFNVKPGIGTVSVSSSFSWQRCSPTGGTVPWFSHPNPIPSGYVKIAIENGDL